MQIPPWLCACSGSLGIWTGGLLNFPRHRLRQETQCSNPVANNPAACPARHHMVYSDEWHAYNQVGSIPGLDHRTVNHSLFFVNPVTGVHTQTIESYWNRIKTKLKTMKGVRCKCCLGISTNSCGGSVLVRTSSRRFVARYPGNIRCNQFCCITYMILGFFLIVSLVNQFGQSSKFVVYPLSCVPNIAFFSLEFEYPSSDPLTPGASY